MEVVSVTLINGATQEQKQHKQGIKYSSCLLCPGDVDFKQMLGRYLVESTGNYYLTRKTPSGGYHSHYCTD